MKKSKNKEQFDYFTFPHEGAGAAVSGSADTFSPHEPAERDYYGGFGEVVGVDEDAFLEEPLVAEEKELQSEQKQKKAQKPDTFGRFRNLYTSRDGEFCLYEDADGHLIALDASKFA